MWMTRVSINHPVFATMVMVALTVLGLFSYAKLGVEAMPDVRPPMVSIQVRYPGASPEQVENDLAKPIENAVNTVAGVKRILSASYEGISFTWIEFRLDVDTDRVTQEVRDKIAQIRAGFPRDVKDPVVQRGGDENDEPVAFYALLGKGLSQRQLTTLGEQVVQKGFERVSGVGRVSLGGTVTREIQVRVDPARLTAFGLTVDQVVTALRNANVSVPVGTISNNTVEAIVRVDGRIDEPAKFGKIIVARKNGAPILLSQVAEVFDTERERNSIARVNGVPAVSFYIFKAQDANIVQVGDNLKIAAEDVRRLLPAGTELKLLRSTSDFVKGAVNNVKVTIIEGALLTVLIVFLFLGSWRSTVITGLTLPIAVIATFISLRVFGFTLNYMTMMALSLCIGLLIDDAIVVRENIVRHIHMGKDHYTAAREGTDEIGLAVLATTFSIVAVFVPIAFMGGIVGKFFYPFGITVAVAVLVSMFVSFTLDPMLSAVWRDPPRGMHETRFIGPVLRGFDRFMERVHAIYGRLLGWVLSPRQWTLGKTVPKMNVPIGVPTIGIWRAIRTMDASHMKPRLATITPRGITLWIAALSFALAIPIAGVVGTEMMPESDESFTSVRLTMPVGSSLEYADERVKRVEQALREFKEIDSIDAGIGTEGAKNTGRLNLKLVPRSERKLSQKKLEQAIRQRLGRDSGYRDESRLGRADLRCAARKQRCSNAARDRGLTAEDRFDSWHHRYRGVSQGGHAGVVGTIETRARFRIRRHLRTARHDAARANRRGELRLLAGTRWSELRSDHADSARQPHRDRRHFGDEHRHHAFDGRRHARGYSATRNRNDRAHFQSGEHPSPGFATQDCAVGQRSGTPFGRCGQGSTGDGQGVRTPARAALRRRRPDSRAGGSQRGNLRCTRTGGDLYLHRAGVAVRQLPAADCDHGVAASVDRRCDARAVDHEHDAEHLFNDRNRLLDGLGDQERDFAGGFRK